MSDEVLLEVTGLNKSFAVPVLKRLNFQLRKGEVHALMGSNGAGKSTLCNIIAGVHQPTSGEMNLNGKAHAPIDVKAASVAGVAMVMQELNLFPTLSIAENLFFNQLATGAGLINHRVLEAKALQALQTVGLQGLDPSTLVNELGVGQQQLVEIARVLSEPVQLLILDEPTAALTDPQIELLFTQIDRLRTKGVGIIYISHRMDEISRIADRISVLRDGELVATEATQDLDSDAIVNLMAGPVEHAAIDGATPRAQLGHLAMRVANLSRDQAFSDISFELKSGEVLGIGGLIGSGRTELLRALFGADCADSGAITIPAAEHCEAQLIRSPTHAIRSGIGMVCEDRKADGLLLQGSIRSNISLSSLPKLHSPFGIMNTDSERTQTADLAQRLAIKHDDLQQPINQLSGGNQQKALIARWLMMDLPILLFDEPTRGVDARAKANIQDLIRQEAARGKAVIVVSSETEELTLVSDRILVMSNGRLAGEFDAKTLKEDSFLEACFRFYSTPNQSTEVA